MRKLDIVQITDKIKGYHFIDQFYLTKCGKAYKLNKTGGFRKKKLNWNKTQYRINIRQKICSFPLQMLKVFRPDDYKKYMQGKYEFLYLDCDRKNVALKNLAIRMKQKYKNELDRGERVVYHEKPPNNIIFDQPLKNIKELEAMLEAKEHEMKVSKYQREQQARKNKKRQEQLDKRNRAKMAAKKEEEASKYSFYIFLHPHGYFAIKVLIDNELKILAKHHSHETLHNFGLWCEGTSNTKDIITEGKRISNSLVREMPRLTDPGEAWGRYNENRKYCD